MAPSSPSDLLTVDDPAAAPVGAEVVIAAESEPDKPVAILKVQDVFEWDRPLRPPRFSAPPTRRTPA